MAEAIIGKIDKPNKPELIYDPEYKHPLVASSYNGHTSLLSNISGKPMLTQYYRSVQGASTEPHGFQPDSIETYQSYTCIKGLIIKIDGDMASNWDGEWSTIGQEGIGYVIFDLAPVPHDVFIGDIGDGRAGLFQLYEEPRIRRVAMDKVYEIQIRLIAIVNRQIEENLNKKTVQTLVYSKDSAIRGGNAVLTVGDYDANKIIAKLESLIIQDHLAEFYYEPEKTIVIPVGSDGTLTYDPYLAKFLSYTFTTRKTGLRDPIETLGVSFGKNQVGGTKLTVWDMFYQENYKFPTRYKQKYYMHNSLDLLNTRYYGGIYYSKMDQAILTEETGASSDAYRYSGNLLFDEVAPSNADDEFKTRSGKTGVAYDYFFSDEFYTGNPTAPHEKFIFDFFRDQTVDKEALIEVLNGYWDLTPIQRCYMAGIYVAAIRISLSTTYNYL